MKTTFKTGMLCSGWRRQLVFVLAVSLASSVFAQDHRFDAPWNTPPASKVMFTVPGVDNVPDLFGDVNDPQLVVFFAGNQFMCVDDLLAAFRRQYSAYERIFAETLPPGILVKQMGGGSLTLGNMRISLKADVFAAGKNTMDQMGERVSKTEVYAYNKLAIMVAKGNPKHITGLKDLGRADVRVAMPNPDFEGIAKQIQEAYKKAGGEELVRAIMETKLRDSSTWLTQIHHRQTPMRILYDQSDAGPVWFSEAYYQEMIGHPVETVKIPETENMQATFVAGQLKDAPHAAAARDFMNFMVSEAAKAIFRKYGFTTE